MRAGHDAEKDSPCAPRPRSHPPSRASARGIARHAKWVLAASVLAIVVMGLYGASVEDHLPAGGLDVPGSESARAAEQAAKRFGIGAADVLALYRNPDGDVLDAEFGSRVIDSLDPVLSRPGRRRRDDRLRHQPENARLARRQRDAGDRVARR